MDSPVLPAVSAAVVLAACLTAAAASAHHNMSAIFDFNAPFTLDGTLVELEWRNPHIRLFVELTVDQDQAETWTFEGPSLNTFRKFETDKSAFEAAVGQALSIKALRARDGSRSGLISVITLPGREPVALCPQNC